MIKIKGSEKHILTNGGHLYDALISALACIKCCTSHDDRQNGFADEQSYCFHEHDTTLTTVLFLYILYAFTLLRHRTQSSARDADMI